ncbi:hypothetical protein HK101_006048 [Irineochytrium annulatum]|nr:hypothetical protein HK101_006048 [Irineochytrium annulatum]
MFYSTSLLTKRDASSLGVIWISSTVGSKASAIKKLSKKVSTDNVWALQLKRDVKVFMRLKKAFAEVSVGGDISMATAEANFATITLIPEEEGNLRPEENFKLSTDKDAEFGWTVNRSNVSSHTQTTSSQSQIIMRDAPSESFDFNPYAESETVSNNAGRASHVASNRSITLSQPYAERSYARDTVDFNHMDDPLGFDDPLNEQNAGFEDIMLSFQDRDQPEFGGGNMMFDGAYNGDAGVGNNNFQVEIDDAQREQGQDEAVRDGVKTKRRKPVDDDGEKKREQPAAKKRKVVKKTFVDSSIELSKLTSKCDYILTWSYCSAEMKELKNYSTVHLFTAEIAAIEKARNELFKRKTLEYMNGPTFMECPTLVALMQIAFERRDEFPDGFLSAAAPPPKKRRPYEKKAKGTANEGSWGGKNIPISRTLTTFFFADDNLNYEQSYGNNYNENEFDVDAPEAGRAAASRAESVGSYSVPWNRTNTTDQQNSVARSAAARSAARSNSVDIHKIESEPMHLGSDEAARPPSVGFPVDDYAPPEFDESNSFGSNVIFSEGEIETQPIDSQKENDSFVRYIRDIMIRINSDEVPFSEIVPRKSSAAVAAQAFYKILALSSCVGEDSFKPAQDGAFEPIRVSFRDASADVEPVY